jgi:TM2 domain-containing membrane protein YozV
MKFLNVFLLTLAVNLSNLICKTLNDNKIINEDGSQNKKIISENFLKDSSNIPKLIEKSDKKLEDHPKEKSYSEIMLHKKSDLNQINLNTPKKRNNMIKLQESIQEKSKSGNNTSRNNGTERKTSNEIDGRNNQVSKHNAQFDSFAVDPYLQYYSEEDRFFYVRNIKCAMSNCPPPSFCMDDKTCKCGEGHANMLLPDMQLQFYCQYRQKQQIVAFLLETFLSLGIGHFYSGRVNFGIIKLLVALSPIILMCCSVCCKGSEANGCLVLSSTLTCAYFIWQIIDIINFATNSYKDGYGVPLEHW